MYAKIWPNLRFICYGFDPYVSKHCELSYNVNHYLSIIKFLCVFISEPRDRAEQRLRMCRDGRGLGSKLVLFAKGFSKHPHIFPIFKVDSEYLRFPFKVKGDYFILYSILVSTFVIFLLLFSMNKKRRTNEASAL